MPYIQGKADMQDLSKAKEHIMLGDIDISHLSPEELMLLDMNTQDIAEAMVRHVYRDDCHMHRIDTLRQK